MSLSGSKGDPFKEVFSFGNVKRHTESNPKSVDLPTMVFVLWPKNSLPRMQNRKIYCQDKINIFGHRA